MKYDVVVIGGGLGGLISGFILSKEGMNVCVLEQHTKLGGNLQTFTRDGCIFDTGMHYIGSMEEGQYLHKYFKYFELTDKLNLKQLDIEGYDTMTFDGDETEYQLAQGYDNFIPKLLEYFPEEKQGLEAYTQKIKSVVRDFPLYDVTRTSSYNIKLELLEDCATEFLHGITNNDRLKNLLAGTFSLYAGYPDNTPLYIHACIRDSLINSSWRPVDGSQQIADRLAEGIQRYGGTVLTSHKVKEFSFNNELAEAVVLENGDKIFAENFISNIHPVTTLKMIGEGKIKKIYRKRIMSLENSWGVFSLYAILKKDSFPYLNKNYFHYNKDGILQTHTGKHDWPDNYYFYTPATSKSDVYADSIVMLADMRYDEVSQWAGSKVNRRGEAYEEFKQRKAEIMLDTLEKRLPGINDKIVKYYTSTPLTFLDYTGTEEGSAYGIMKNCREPLRSIILPRTKISNLLFTGQNMNLHGILGVTASAVITCSELVGIEHLTNKISNG
ncbi:MAG: NAD(P)-binding protein [Bacteroidota bacterium]